MKKSLLIGLFLALPSFAQVVPTQTSPLANTGIVAPQLYGAGSPITLGLSCSTAASTMNVLYLDTSASGLGKRFWLCDSSTGSPAWENFTAPVATAVTSSIGGGTVTSFGCSSTTVAMSGATVGTNAAFAAPLSNPGSPLLFVQAYVSAANTVTVSVCNLSASLLSNMPGSQYKILLF